MSQVVSFIKEKRGPFVFLLLFVFMAVSYYDSVLDKEPLNTHTWRQTDCLSLTRNYAEGNGLLEPEMDILLADEYTTGKTAGEFPILYYTVGKIWAMTGESVLIYRIFYLMILFVALYCLFQSLRLLLGSEFWSIGIALALFTSPVFVNYGVSFLTDVPAFCFVLIALHSLHLYVLRRKYPWFFMAMLFFALGGLIKVSSLILFVLVLFIFSLEFILKFKSLGKSFLFQRTGKEVAGFSLVFASLLGWYLYSDYYNNLHGFKYTFNNIYPLWDSSIWEPEKLYAGMKNFTSHIFFSRVMIYALLILFFINLFTRVKSLSVFGYFSNLLVMLGIIFYFILWGPLLENHDYYFVAILAIYPAVILPFIYRIKRDFPELIQSKLTKVGFAVFFIFNFIYCLQVTQLKTTAQNGLFLAVGNHHLVNEMTWFNWDITNNHHAYKRMQPYLKEVGVQEEDLVISLPDPTFNETLYLMDRRGWTNFKNLSSKEEIDYLISKGAKYLIIEDSYLNAAHVQPFLDKKVGTYHHIHIFSLDKR